MYCSFVASYRGRRSQNARVGHFTDTKRNIVASLSFSHITTANRANGAVFFGVNVYIGAAFTPAVSHSVSAGR